MHFSQTFTFFLLNSCCMLEIIDKFSFVDDSKAQLSTQTLVQNLSQWTALEAPGRVFCVFPTLPFFSAFFTFFLFPLLQTLFLCSFPLLYSQAVFFPTQFTCLFCLQICLHSDSELLTLSNSSIRKKLSQVIVPNFFVSYHFLHGHKPCGDSNSRCNCATESCMSFTLKLAIKKSLLSILF